MSAFLTALRSGRVLLMDGAMGTELQRAGIGQGECCELWNMTHAEQVLAIHRAYVAAGAEVLLTNTFQAHHAALARHGVHGRLAEIQAAGVELAKTAAGPQRFVLADIGPDEGLASAGTGFFDGYHATDGILLETRSDFESLNEALNSQMPVLISFAFLRDAHGALRTHPGLTPEAVAAQVDTSGAAALGVNCGRDISIADMIEILRRYRSTTALPLFARPNAGTPVRTGSGWDYPGTPDAMAGRLHDLLDSGIAMIGGCCGTTPQHIAAFQPIVAAWNARRRSV